MGTDDVPLLAFPVACFQLLWAAALAAAVGVAAARWPSEEQRGSSGSGFSCEASVATPFMAALGGLLATAVVAGALAAWATWEGLKGEEKKRDDWKWFIVGNQKKKLNPPLFLLLPLSLSPGSILDVDLRRRVPPLVYALVASLAAETAFLVFATVLASRPLPECAKLLTTATAAGGVSLSSTPPRHPWASPAVAVRALVFTAWGSVALLLLVAALASAAAPDPADEAAWAARCRCLVLACCPAAAVPGGRAATARTMTKKVRSRGGAGGVSSAPSAGASTTAAAAAAVVSSSAVSGSAAGSSPRGKRQRWWSFLWPFSSSSSKRRRRSSRQRGRRRTTSDAAAASSNPVSPRAGALPPLQQQQQQLSLKQRTRSLDSTGVFDESDGEEEGKERSNSGENDEEEESNSEDDSDLEEGRGGGGGGGNPAPPYQRLGVLFKQVRKDMERERKS